MKLDEACKAMKAAPPSMVRGQCMGVPDQNTTALIVLLQLDSLARSVPLRKRARHRCNHTRVSCVWDQGHRVGQADVQPFPCCAAIK